MLSDAKLTELFIRRFDCAIKKIKRTPGKVLDYGRYSGYEFVGLDRKASQHYKIWTMDERHYTAVNPLGMMLAGKRRLTGSAQQDLGRHWFSLHPNMHTVLAPFLQGYVFIESYRDCWAHPNNKVDSVNYHNSIFFNLGRAFIERYVGYRLPYDLPLHIKTIINSLSK